MTDPRAFADMRLQGLLGWCSTAPDPYKMGRKDLRDIFGFVLRHQQPTGEWHLDDDSTWDVVMTAVVLKSLAAVGYRPGDSLPNGSVASALRYLTDPFEKGSPDTRVGEDVWDTCQALLALAAFDRRDAGLQQAQYIAKRWQELYEAEKRRGVEWCGPAYVAAMADVCLRYRDDVDTDCVEILRFLRSLEDGKTAGLFPAESDDRNKHRWNTSLVLRTLCAEPVDVDLVERCAGWLLNEWEARKGEKGGRWEADIKEAPMYTARCMEGLNRAASLVNSKLAREIALALETGNKTLSRYWNTKKGTLKSYTAVAEYLSTLRIPAPAGLLFDAPAPRASETVTHESRKTVFIVHGRDEGPLAELKDYIQNTLHLGLPIILKNESEGGMTVIEKFERQAKSAALVFVLVTPDDVGALATERDELKPRARQNVVLELGYFIGKLERTSGRVIILEKTDKGLGKLDWPSDLGGMIPIDISNGISAASEKIRRNLSEDILKELSDAGD